MELTVKPAIAADRSPPGAEEAVRVDIGRRPLLQSSVVRQAHGRGHADAGTAVSEPEQSRPDTPGPEPISLATGSEVGGHVLSSRIANDAFCSIWVTEPLEEGPADTCIRLIPDANLTVQGARERFRAEREFWLKLDSTRVVPLYDCGWEDGWYYALMRYMQKGSLADQRGRDSWVSDLLPQFALDLADALRQLHGAVGPHGNLKPANVFPVRGQRVLLSDFALPLWLDEFDAGSVPILSHLVHPYRAPEQYESARDYDTRSDIYSFGLILLWCLDGTLPPLDRHEAEAENAPWPGELAAVACRCVKRDRRDRYGDGLELFEALCSATGLVLPRQEEAPTGLRRASGRPMAPAAEPLAREAALSPDTAAAADRLHEAQILVGKGLLSEALQVLESLPRGTAGVSELLDDIERRHEEGERLANEAIRLAGMGQVKAAVEAVKQAEKLWAESRTIKAVRAELDAVSDYAEETVDAGVSPALREALEAGRYGDARPILERLLRAGAISDELRQAVRQFKRGRARKAFLSSIRAAKRAYAAGRHDKSEEYWLEAAAWLPAGADRERIRKIARAAAAGRLLLEGRDAQRPPSEETQAKPAPPVPQAPSAAQPQPPPPPARRREHPLGKLWLVVLIGLILGAILGVLVALF
jgi:tetratricopeptide (TPR) repeat protein